ncbi:MAG TPA: hypothetical protein VFV38_12405, partial [Ktedonobacteraceae bacterium]|nr:hypothetical protein [Ktedonobacteraceae bacterium]
LRPLMELLGRRECFHEALEYYERLCKILEAEECQPDAQTQDVAAFLRAKQLQRSPQPPLSPIQVEQIRQEARFPASTRVEALIKHDEPRETATDAFLSQGSSPAPQEEHAMAPFDTSRRLLLQQVFGLTCLAVSPSSQTLEQFLQEQERTKPFDTPTFFALRDLIETCWQFCNAGRMQLAEHILASFLPEVLDRASFQPEAARLASQALRLKSILLAHQLHLSSMLPLCQQSVAYAQTTHDPDILSAALNGLAVAFKYNRQSLRSFEAYEAALRISERATPLLRSRVYAGAASIFASKGLRQDAFRLIGLAYEQFPDHPEHDPAFFSADHGRYMLAYYEGLVYLALEQPEDALQAFDRYHQDATAQPIPERNRLEILNQRGRAAILSGDLDSYIACLEEGVTGAVALQSQKRLDEALEIFSEQMPHAWLKEPAIVQLQERFSFTRWQS